MKRTPSELGREQFDLLVVGGGIHGACVAREAVLGGLSTALVDRSDFGSATSANSLKIIHGGLRYLQSLDVRRMRESVRERRAMMRIAPHLVRPLPCVVPTQGRGRRGRTAMRVALKLAAWIAPDGQMPPSEILSRRSVLELFPGLADDRAITGGALWYDAQAVNTERLTLAFVRSAVERGAAAVNHAEVVRFLMHDGRVAGAVVRDVIDGGELEVRARMVVNAAGPWVGRVASGAGIGLSGARAMLARGWNVVTRSLHPTHALGVLMRGDGRRGRGEGRFLFVAPWRGRSIIGTLYAPADGDGRPDASDREVAELVAEINRAYPAADIRPADVLFRHGGLLPVARRDDSRGIDKLAEHHEIIDHEREHATGGLLSVIGVKYTTARGVAERVINEVTARLGRTPSPEDGSRIGVDGGDLGNVPAFEARMRAAAPQALQPHIGRLMRNYGSRAAELVAHCRSNGDDAAPVADGSDATPAEIRYAVRREMAVRLADVVLRRTDLGTAGDPGERALRRCADIMGEELGWSTDRIEEEIALVRGLYGRGEGDAGTGSGHDPPGSGG